MGAIELEKGCLLWRKQKVDLKEINSKIDIHHWYYATKFSASKDILAKSGAWPAYASEKNVVLVDIGAGSGIFTKAFAESFGTSIKGAYAVDLFYPLEMIRVVDGINFVVELPQEILPSHLLFIDVLEHIENDVHFLKKWVNISPAGSFFLITVPAFEFLWSGHDVFLGHKRRYKLTDIEEVVNNAGLEVIRSRYLFALILPVVYCVRKVYEPLLNNLGFYKNKGIKPANPLLNFLLKSILRIEVKLWQFNRLIGLSCLVVAKKRKT